MDLKFGIPKLKIPASCNTIKSSFNNMPDLSELDLGSGINEITRSFEKLPKLKSLNIPNSVSNINESFQELPKLEKLTFEEGIEVISQSFYETPNLKELILPNTITNINNSFNDLSSLQKLVIPNSVVNIDNHSFDGFLNIEEIYFGNEWSNIEDFNSLFVVKDGKTKKIHFPWKDIPEYRGSVDNNIIEGEANLIIYVPVGMADAYKNKWHFLSSQNVQLLEE